MFHFNTAFTRHYYNCILSAIYHYFEPQQLSLLESTSVDQQLDILFSRHFSSVERQHETSYIFSNIIFI